MRIQDIHEQQALGAALIVLGFSLGGAAAAASLLALEHMALAVEMCGPTAGHCVSCVAAAALLVATLGTFGAGVRLIQSVPALELAR